MASNDMQKYLDQDGVATLWSRVVEKIEEESSPTKQLSESNASNIATIQNQIKTLQDEAYDDTEVRRLISNNLTKINAHIDTTNTLQGDVNTEGSVRNIATAIAAAEIAKVVAGADKDFDTLKEIADWILNDTTGAADMANDISALQNLVGSTKVATQITNALQTNGVDKYALATELTSLANRVQTLEKSGFMNAASVDSAIDAKINALKLADTYEAKGAAATALTNAQAYSDASLVVAKTYADINKVDIQTPEIKTDLAVTRSADENTTSVLMLVNYGEGDEVELNVGMAGPLEVTEEEMIEFGMSEEEIAFYKRLYGKTTKPLKGCINLFDGQGGGVYLEPNPYSNSYQVIHLPSESGTLLTEEVLLEIFESPYFAQIITDALGVYSGGDY